MYTLAQMYTQLPAWYRTRTVKKQNVANIASLEDARALVQVHDCGDGPDALAARLVRFFTAFPPTECAMRQLSLLQQKHFGEGGASDYVATLVFITATEAIAECGRAARPARRRHTATEVCLRHRARRRHSFPR